MLLKLINIYVVNGSHKIKTLIRRGLLKIDVKNIVHIKSRIGKTSCIIGTMVATRKINANGKLNLVDLTEQSGVFLVENEQT